MLSLTFRRLVELNFFSEELKTHSSSNNNIFDGSSKKKYTGKLLLCAYESSQELFTVEGLSNIPVKCCMEERFALNMIFIAERSRHNIQYSFASSAGEAGVCAPNPCKNGASCREREIPKSIYWQPQDPLPYECQCLYGWEGANCTENVDDCKSNPCLNGGSCEDRPNAQYVCHCEPGFIGM